MAEEFQDGPPPVLSLGSEAHTNAVKDLFVFVRLNPIWSVQTIAEQQSYGM